MATIVWDDKIYSVGIRKMDDQHKQLIGLINALHAQRTSLNRDFITTIFTTLVHYTRQHFTDEEKLLRKIGFPHLPAHHQQHLKFIHSVETFRAKFEQQGPTVEIIDKLSDFLSEWLKHHILVDDRAYGNYLES